MHNEFKDYRISGEDVELIREMLLVGLASYGEIEKTISAFDLAALRTAPVSDGARPAHPTGESDTVAKFAAVLHCLHRLPPVEAAETAIG
jgi:hypothetical protein